MKRVASLGHRPMGLVAAGFALAGLFWFDSAGVAPAARLVSSAPLTSVAARNGNPHPPAVEPVAFAAVAPEQARELNAALPFAGSFGPAARPFAFSGDEVSRERAIDCLASAMWYEAGDDPDDQGAVAQVVLNRVRHPAFPASVCGTVFQGAERRTGCQFTFTCDGAMRRIPPEAAFERARALARAMLAGSVDPRVGLATHYHTDWVFPVWSAAMDKLVQVGPHLFFRWRGEWGRASAMRQDYGAHEPIIPALAALSLAHRPGGEAPIQDEAIELANVMPAVDVEVSPPALPLTAPSAAQPSSSSLHVDVSLSKGAGVPALAALDLCGNRAICKVEGTAEGGDIVFVYVRDRRTGVERALWDCSRFPRANTEQCLGPATRRWLGFEGNLRASRSS